MNEAVIEVVQFVITMFVGIFVTDVVITIGAKLVSFGTSAFDHIKFNNKVRK